MHKVDRLARSRADDVTINLAIRAAGARLVSVTESIDDTPSGTLLHGIMSSIAEFYSRNLANEVVKGILQKVQNGGTPTRAPIGYTNVRKTVEGREIRTVEVDRARADHVRWAFATYADGEMSLRQLAEHMEARGLTQPATPKLPERPLPVNRLQSMLRNRYYLGYVSWRGMEYKGSHAPLISPDVFQQVQDVLDAHRLAGERPQRHRHYLTGSLYCKRCESRLIYTETTGNGGSYAYFGCLGRHSGRTSCDLPYVAADWLEASVIQLWVGEQARWTATAVGLIESGLTADLAAFQAEADQAHGRFAERIQQIQRERLLWADKAMNGVVPDDIARDKQRQLGQQLTSLQSQQARLTKTTLDQTLVLKSAVTLIKDCARIYARSDEHSRRTLNQAWFDRIEVDGPDNDAPVRDASRTPMMEALFNVENEYVAATSTRLVKSGEVAESMPRDPVHEHKNAIGT